jgi:hypothetical protein
MRKSILIFSIGEMPSFFPVGDTHGEIHFLGSRKSVLFNPKQKKQEIFDRKLLP